MTVEIDETTPIPESTVAEAATQLSESFKQMQEATEELSGVMTELSDGFASVSESAKSREKRTARQPASPTGTDRPQMAADD